MLGQCGACVHCSWLVAPLSGWHTPGPRNCVSGARMVNRRPILFDALLQAHSPCVCAEEVFMLEKRCTII